MEQLELLGPKTTKRCSRCKQILPKLDFHRQKSMHDGLNPYCKPCQSAYQRAVREGPKREQYQEMRRRTHLLRRYKITMEQYEAIFEAQGGRCAICRSTPEERPGRSGRLVVDHDHACCPGQESCGACVRGLLCGICNHGIGSFKDDTGALAAAIAYLDEHRRQG